MSESSKQQPARGSASPGPTPSINVPYQSPPNTQSKQKKSRKIRFAISKRVTHKDILYELKQKYRAEKVQRLTVNDLWSVYVNARDSDAGKKLLKKFEKSKASFGGADRTRALEECGRAWCHEARCLFPEMDVTLGHALHLGTDSTERARSRRLRMAAEKFAQVISVAAVITAMTKDDKRLQREQSYAFFGLALLHLPINLNRRAIFEQYAAQWLRYCSHVTLERRDTETMARFLAANMFDEQFAAALRRLAAKTLTTGGVMAVRAAVARIEETMLIEAFADHAKSDRRSKMRQLFGKFCRVKHEIGSKALTDTAFDGAWLLRDSVPKPRKVNQPQPQQSQPQQQQQQPPNRVNKLFSRIEMKESGLLAARTTISAKQVIFCESLLVYSPPGASFPHAMSSSDHGILCVNCHRKLVDWVCVPCDSCLYAWFCDVDCAQMAAKNGRHCARWCARSPPRSAKAAAFVYDLLQIAASNEDAAALIESIRTNYLTGFDDSIIPVSLNLVSQLVLLAVSLGIADGSATAESEQHKAKITELYKLMYVFDERCARQSLQPLPIIGIDKRGGGGGRRSRKGRQQARAGFGIGPIGVLLRGSPNPNMVRRFDAKRGVLEYVATRRIEAGQYLLLGKSICDETAILAELNVQIGVGGVNARNWAQKFIPPIRTSTEARVAVATSSTAEK